MIYVSRGASWRSMKGLWQKVVPMVRCWKVLVLLRLEGDYEASCSALERMAWCPKGNEFQDRHQAYEEHDAGPGGSPGNRSLADGGIVVLGSDTQFELP
jgi:hypothetical protein